MAFLVPSAPFLFGATFPARTRGPLIAAVPVSVAELGFPNGREAGGYPVTLAAATLPAIGRGFHAWLRDLTTDFLPNVAAESFAVALAALWVFVLVGHAVGARMRSWIAVRCSGSKYRERTE